MGSRATYKEALQKLCRVLKYYVKTTPQKRFEKDKIAAYDFRIGHIEGRPVKRVVVQLRSSGCNWKKSGGCTMCGFWIETTQRKEKISTEDFANQFKGFLTDIDIKKIPILCIYNAGSMLDEEEVPSAALEKIFNMIKSLPEIKRVILESRIDCVDFEKVKRLENIIKGKELIIASGLESSDDTIRELCIHKGIQKNHFERYIEKANSQGVKTRIYIFIKPPFLTETEAIEDAVRSTKYLWDLGVKDIHYETMTIEENTLVYDMYERGYYHLPWLWSVIEIIKRVSSFARPYISPFRYITEAKDVPHNCNCCSDKVTKALLNDYNSDFDLKHIKDLTCTCKSQWENAVKEQNDQPIEKRILDILTKISPEL